MVKPCQKMAVAENGNTWENTWHSVLCRHQALHHHKQVGLAAV